MMLPVTQRPVPATYTATSLTGSTNILDRARPVIREHSPQQSQACPSDGCRSSRSIRCRHLHTKIDQVTIGLDETRPNIPTPHRPIFARTTFRKVGSKAALRCHSPPENSGGYCVTDRRRESETCWRAASMNVMARPAACEVRFATSPNTWEIFEGASRSGMTNLSNQPGHCHPGPCIGEHGTWLNHAHGPSHRLVRLHAFRVVAEVRLQVGF